MGEGDCFVALRGESVRRARLPRQAVEKGATALIVADARARDGLGVPVYAVADTLVALGALGAVSGGAPGARPVVGVVGTNGKTSTKELLRAALGATMHGARDGGELQQPRRRAAHALRAFRDDADIAVIEMGTNQPGEVAALRAIVEPDVVVVTSIAEEHLEGLGDLAGVLREEVSACDGVAVRRGARRRSPRSWPPRARWRAAW